MARDPHGDRFGEDCDNTSVSSLGTTSVGIEYFKKKLEERKQRRHQGKRRQLEHRPSRHPVVERTEKRRRTGHRTSRKRHLWIWFGMFLFVMLSMYHQSNYIKSIIETFSSVKFPTSFDELLVQFQLQSETGTMEPEEPLSHEKSPLFTYSTLKTYESSRLRNMVPEDERHQTSSGRKSNNDKETTTFKYAKYQQDNDQYQQVLHKPIDQPVHAMQSMQQSSSLNHQKVVPDLTGTSRVYPTMQTMQKMIPPVDQPDLPQNKVSGGNTNQAMLQSMQQIIPIEEPALVAQNNVMGGQIDQTMATAQIDQTMQQSIPVQQANLENDVMSGQTSNAEENSTLLEAPMALSQPQQSVEESAIQDQPNIREPPKIPEQPKASPEPQDFMAQNLVNYHDASLNSSSYTPIFWHIPKAGGTFVHDMTSGCLNLTVAHVHGVEFGHANDTELTVFRTPAGRKYVNVDVTSRAGIERAKNMGLAASHLADILITSQVRYATEQIFSPDHPGFAFTMMRHPVERSISTFYYLQKAYWEPTYRPDFKNWTLLQFVRRDDMDADWMVRFLLGKQGSPSTVPLTRDDLERAKAIVRDKLWVGFMEEMQESLRRIGKKLGWSAIPGFEKCIGGTSNTNRHTAVSKDSTEWKELAQIHSLDLELYEYARSLW